MIDIPGEERRPMNPHEIVKALSQQQEHIKLLTSRIRELESLLANQNELDKKPLTDHT
jgi:hypothetical protein